MLYKYRWYCYKIRIKIELGFTRGTKFNKNNQQSILLFVYGKICHNHLLWFVVVNLVFIKIRQIKTEIIIFWFLVCRSITAFDGQILTRSGNFMIPKKSISCPQPMKHLMTRILYKNFKWVTTVINPKWRWNILNQPRQTKCCENVCFVEKDK